MARQVRDLKFDPLDSSHLFAATDAGLFRSVDFGATWQPAAFPAGSDWTAWSVAYVGTGASVLAGFFYYANFLLRDLIHHEVSALLLCVIAIAISMWTAWRPFMVSPIRWPPPIGTMSWNSIIWTAGP